MTRTAISMRSATWWSPGQRTPTSTTSGRSWCFEREGGEIAGGHGPEPRPHPEARCQRERPVCLTQLEGDVHHRFVYTHVRADCCDHLSPPGLESRRSLLATARSHSLFVINRPWNEHERCIRSFPALRSI